MLQPKDEINEEHLVHFAAVQCSDEDIASAFACSPRRLRRGFGRLLRHTRAKARCNLRKMQWASAMKGSVPMLVWLGRQYLAQQTVINTATEDRSIFVRRIDRRRFERQRVGDSDGTCPSA